MATDWADELRKRKKRHDDAVEKLNDLKSQHRDLVVGLTYDLPITEVAELSGWSVAYLRRLRSSGPKEGVLSKTTFTPRVLVQDSLGACEDAADVVERTRQDYIGYMRELTEPNLSMSDVAEVVGISRQRVSQLLASI